MPRTPDEYAVHLLMNGGHREVVRFPTIKDFQKWYAAEVVHKKDSDDFVSVPMKTAEGEYMVVRPVSILAIRVEPVYTSSIDRTPMDD
ncbi:hypothetical protein PJF56_08695 [Roseofilum sp. BLCC_M91]|uniref:Bro-N domain-containing protein n=1 Tax=Roseofilum halophilum BLCC-M91 TaxID=3022259 RepID=A0ABT7BK25_9CYAN|nr:hypothetical protein [Roseofilum halophilum]MDJ1178939.1 hypothetical protein [Roseofilum halophilum BLCC-M91]